jgi:zinc/manganese transport system substrate-binding protein
MHALIGLLALVFAASAPRADPVRIVAAESVYGNVARQVGGAYVTVSSILDGPNQDPHDFDASAATARAIAGARIVIYNGLGYDAWAVHLLSASRSSSREVIEVARLAGKKAGANPHLWYDPSAVSALGAKLRDMLSALDPAHRREYASGLEAFEASLRPLREKIAAMRARHTGRPVTATEPVFDYMADALGLEMRNRRFQLAVMNGTEPGAASIAAFENDLRRRAPKALLYNTQTSQALAERMRRIASQAGVPVVPITETQPEGRSYAEWMLAQLDALDRALGER